MTKREWLGVLQHVLVLFTPLWTDVLAPGSSGAETSSKVADGLVVEQRRLLPAFLMLSAHCRESLREPHQSSCPWDVSPEILAADLRAPSHRQEQYAAPLGKGGPAIAVPALPFKTVAQATWLPQDLEILVATSLDSIFFCGPARTMGEDAAYPCREYLVPPYKEYGNLSPKQHAFNTKLRSTRVLIENAFGILKNRFRQLKVLEFISVERMCQFTMLCCVIHNLCIDGDDLMGPGAPEPTKRTTPYEDEDEVEAALQILGERKRSALVRMVC
ncbi:putative nuclease HARBI1 isoform X2 [Ixodes scapularis]